MIVRIVISAVLMLVLIYVVSPEKLIGKLSDIDVFVMLVAIILLCLQNIIGAIRWGVIIRTLGEHLPSRYVFSIYITGSVANLLLLTSVGGISVRAILLVKQGVNMLPVVISLFLEKVFIFASLLISFFVGAYIIKLNIDDQIIDTTIYYAYLLVAIVITLVVVSLLFFKYNNLKQTLRVSELLSLVFNHLRPVLILFGSSLVGLFLGFAAIGVIATGLNIDTSLMLLLSIQPVIAITSSLPISVGGWGVRETSMVLGLSLLSVNSQEALALSILYGVTGIFATILLAGITTAFGFGDGMIKNLASVKRAQTEENN